MQNQEGKIMNAEYLKELLAYNAWADRKILGTASHLTEEQRHAPMPKGFSAGSLHNTLRHVLFAEWLWLRRCLGHSVTGAEFPDAEVETFPAMLNFWKVETFTMSAFAEALKNQDLERSIHYARANGEPYSNTIREVLTQMCFHGMQHRAECAVILTEFGYSPGNIDFIWFLREKDAKTS